MFVAKEAGKAFRGKHTARSQQISVFNTASCLLSS
jgi:hypothetical protein